MNINIYDYNIFKIIKFIYYFENIYYYIKKSYIELKINTNENVHYIKIITIIKTVLIFLFFF